MVTIYNIGEYLEKAFDGVKIVVGIVLSWFCYYCFPTDAYMISAKSVGVAMLLDILSKYIALAKQAGGWQVAFKSRKIFSRTLWDKTSVKLQTYLILAILVGAAYRVSPIAEIGLYFGTLVYTVIFLREAQSVVENLDDAGAKLDWLVRWTKKKQKQICDDEQK